jgi:hypothetical protein
MIHSGTGTSSIHSLTYDVCDLSVSMLVMRLKSPIEVAWSGVGRAGCAVGSGYVWWPGGRIYFEKI